MSRPHDGLAHVAASLARLVAGERPEWVRARSWALAHELVASLRSDATEALDNGPTDAALALAAADGVRPFGGGEVVALPPAEETSEGRRWSF